LALALALNSYIPIFFIFIFLSFIGACLIIRPQWIWLGLKVLRIFIVEKPWLSLACILGIFLAIMPAALWYFDSNPHEYVLNIDLFYFYFLHLAYLCLFNFTRH
jgi:hypothetical protein